MSKAARITWEAVEQLSEDDLHRLWDVEVEILTGERDGDIEAIIVGVENLARKLRAGLTTNDDDGSPSRITTKRRSNGVVALVHAGNVVHLVGLRRSISVAVPQRTVAIANGESESIKKYRATEVVELANNGNVVHLLGRRPYHRPSTLAA
jgi:hypothetical protein